MITGVGMSYRRADGVNVIAIGALGRSVAAKLLFSGRSAGNVALHFSQFLFQPRTKQIPVPILDDVRPARSTHLRAQLGVGKQAL